MTPALRLLPLTLPIALVTGCSSGPPPDRHAGDVTTPEAATARFAEIETELQQEPVHLAFRVTAEGAHTAAIEGEWWTDGADRLRLVARGTFGGREIDLRLVCDGTRLRGGNGGETIDVPAPPRLREAMAVGFTRMGILHNLARLTADQSPDHAEGGVAEWVRVHDIEPGLAGTIGEVQARPLSFDIEVSGQPAGSAILWIDRRHGRPLNRTQRVEFPQGVMQVLEEYTSYRAGEAIDAGQFEHDAAE